MSVKLTMPCPHTDFLFLPVRTADLFIHMSREFLSGCCLIAVIHEAEVINFNEGVFAALLKRRTRFIRSMTHRVHLQLQYVLGVVKQLKESSGPAHSSAFFVILSTLAPTGMDGN